MKTNLVPKSYPLWLKKLLAKEKLQQGPHRRAQDGKHQRGAHFGKMLKGKSARICPEEEKSVCA